MPLDSSDTVPQSIIDDAIEINRQIRTINDGLQVDKLFKGRILLSGFDVGMELLKDEHKVYLEQLIAISLNQDFEITLIEGRASRTGPELPYPQGHFMGNIPLSLLRAEGVAQYLINPENKVGIDSSKIKLGCIVGNGSNHVENDEKGIELGINRSVLIEFKFAIIHDIIFPEVNKDNIEIDEVNCGEIGKSREWSITQCSLGLAPGLKFLKESKKYIE